MTFPMMLMNYQFIDFSNIIVMMKLPLELMNNMATNLQSLHILRMKKYKENSMRGKIIKSLMELHCVSCVMTLKQGN